MEPTEFESLRRKYGVGPRFLAAYLRFFVKDPEPYRDDASIDDLALGTLSDTDRMWLDYALGANERGRGLRDKLVAGRLTPDMRVLDIGCGVGGILVAFAEAGAQVVGIEVAPERLALAGINLRDTGAGGAAIDRDILSPELPRELGQFDRIFMIDVIEHVLDQPAAVRNIAALLAPGGRALVEAPNGNALEKVCKDGHFQLFGITLCPHELAREYHAAKFDFEYDVGYYVSLETLLSQFCEAGLSCWVEPPDAGSLPNTIPYLQYWLEQCDLARQAFVADDGVPRHVREAVAGCYDAFRGELALRLQSAAELPEGPDRTAAWTELYMRYCFTTWRFHLTGVERPGGKAHANRP